MPAAFDNSQIVPSVDFDYPLEAGDLDESRAKQELLRLMLEKLPVKSITGTGQRFIAFLFLIEETGMTQAQLAKRMNVTPGRVSQILNTVRKDLSSLFAGFHGFCSDGDKILSPNR